MEMRRRHSVDRPSRLIAEQPVERLAERGRSDRIEPALRKEKRRQPLVESPEQCHIAEVRDGWLVFGSEGRALTKGRRALVPRQDAEAMAADGLDQPGLDRGLVGPGIGRGGKANCPELAALCCADRG